MHKPVLLDEVISFLNIQKDKIYVDCTLGFAGHSLEILKKLDGTGILIGIEKDKDTLEFAKENLKDFSNIKLFNSNFLDLKNILKSLNIEKITGGVLLDLGINSYQLSDSKRGFSFNSNGPLDMRMDTTQKLDAEYVVNKYSERELSDLIFNYGEERYSRAIARRIIYERTRNGPIKTTEALAKIIYQCYPKSRTLKISPATRTFQAIRIEVNQELENLKEFLCFIPELLEVDSRLTVISFHSLEDRIVKNKFKENETFQILTKKPITPLRNEILNNKRARSGKLRVAKKTD